MKRKTRPQTNEENKSITTPGLFGLKNSNKNFSDNFAWGKNQFNNTFPAALACYMHSKKLDPVYIKLKDDLSTSYNKIKVEEIFGADPALVDIFFAFEHEFKPYKRFVSGHLPRVDLVTIEIENDRKKYLRPVEIKLTALPDNQTSELSEKEYGSEIVVRPDTIVYLTLSICEIYESEREKLQKTLTVYGKKIDWTKTRLVAPLIPSIVRAINKILIDKIDNQRPLLIQPIWKTKGKSAVLHDNCLDMFVWSDFAFTRLFVNRVREEYDQRTITRPLRTIVWLGKMLYEFAEKGTMNPQIIIDTLTYDTKNDKAFALGGKSTHPYMDSPELRMPRIKKTEIKNMILGGGEKLLSPERRFDGIIQGTLDIFG